ncbi:response regulator transcription factor (plasmid) [Streptomyces sp. NBC_00335]|uniref:response regulator transcription factor n=1 Tax=unclassified Streptomyces TaxID=2593676 RepID=UPI00224C9650|nr:MULTISPECIES: response regulator transcription factor [unclassified Streptomyces]MCX5410057.1 response regulator transcription factor [Streptomyces sp. NBC_00086]
MRTVLIVEDDDGIAEALEQALTVHGYGTCRTGTGAAALEQLDDASLVLLDLGLPDLAGHEVCRRIRERSCVPVIALSGRADELDRVMALHMGADDFVAKPFGRYELMARIQAVFRRTGDCPRHDGAPAAHGPLPEPGSLREPEHEHEHDPERGLERGPGAGAGRPGGILRAGPLSLDRRARKVYLDGTEVRITRKEFELLAMLLEEPGTVMERQDIMARVWDENWFGSTRTLDVHVGSLRGKLGSNDWIEAARGVGYRLTVPRPRAS